MKFNLTLIIRGDAGTVEAPNKYNPIEADDLSDCLHKIADNVPPGNELFRVVGVKIEEARS